MWEAIQFVHSMSGLPLGSTAQFPKELVEELIAGATALDRTKALLVTELVVPAQMKATKVELK
jgi:hypothetical protein